MSCRQHELEDVYERLSSFQIHIDRSEELEDFFVSCRTEVLEVLFESPEGCLVAAQAVKFFSRSKDNEITIRSKKTLKKLLDAVRKMENPSFKLVIDTSSAVVAVNVESDFICSWLEFFCKFIVDHSAKVDVIESVQTLTVLLSLLSERGERSANEVWVRSLICFCRVLLTHNSEKLTETLRFSVWNLVTTLYKIFGYDFFNIDAEFFVLLAKLNAVEVQMVLHDPKNVDVQRFILHSSILEGFNLCIESEPSSSPSELEAVEKCHMEAAQGIVSAIRYIVEFYLLSVQVEEDISDEISLELWKFCVDLLRNGQAAVLKSDTLRKITPILIQKMNAINISSSSSTDVIVDYQRVFLDVLPDLPVLTAITPVVFVELIAKRYENHKEDWIEIFFETFMVFESLKERKDWYTKETLAAACKRLASIPNKEVVRLNDLFEELRSRMMAS
ncbi:unnamed protein product [Caenorhabditis auriculariae]|uniref:Uncharacterized protein n=1 Tax=Caenorhabditis auriculariae TaxID=2777116 RepID=A0A8S1GXB7_9PELO|nr:unnamed protein product [Caenorhabditis auriculariae]